MAIEFFFREANRGFLGLSPLLHEPKQQALALAIGEWKPFLLSIFRDVVRISFRIFRYLRHAAGICRADMNERMKSSSFRHGGHERCPALPRGVEGSNTAASEP